MDFRVFQQEGFTYLCSKTDSNHGLDPEPGQKLRGPAVYFYSASALPAAIIVVDFYTSMIKAASRAEWRAWLMENHASEAEVWLIYYKKHTQKASVTYIESVQEALCFGWIDGTKKSIDGETYTHRFTPRRSASKWSITNIRLAKDLIEKGKMAAAGLKAFEQRQEYDVEALEAQRACAETLTAETENQLKTHRQAWDNFNQLSPGYRRQYVMWLQTAKRPETKQKRLKQAIVRLAQNKHLGMK